MDSRIWSLVPSPLGLMKIFSISVNEGDREVFRYDVGVPLLSIVICLLD